MKELVKRAQHGDAQAFASLIESSKRSLYATAKAVLHNDADAADAIQDAVLKAWQKLPRLQEPAYFHTWLTRILLYRCYDMLRRQKRVIPVEQVPEQAGGPPSDTALDVDAALSALAKNDRLVLTLFYLDDLSTRQIAQILSLNENTVRTRLSRARARFKAVWQSKEDAI